VQTTEKGIQAVYREAGRYFIDLIGIDPDQNVFRKRITVTAKAPQSAVTFTMDPETPTAPALVTFDASDTFIPNGEEITGFEWDFGDDSNAGDSKFSGSSIQHKFEKAGTYQITLSVRTTSGKVFTGKQTLVVRAPLTDACFLPSRRTGKAPLGVRFDSACSTGNFTSWLWDFGDSSQSDQQNPTHVFLKAGEFTVTFTATTSDGLKSVKTSVISVTE
jgi:PKD repeat protein